MALKDVVKKGGAINTQYHIVSDGTSFGTKILNTKTGKMIGLVQKVTWSVGIDDTLSKCNIEILGMPLDVKTSLEEIKFSNIQSQPVDKVVEKTIESIKKKELRDKSIEAEKAEINKEKENKEFLKHVKSVAQVEKNTNKQGVK